MSMWLKWNEIEYFPSRLDFGIFIPMGFKKRLQQLAIAWLDQADPKLFERHPYLRLKTSLLNLKKRIKNYDCDDLW